MKNKIQYILIILAIIFAASGCAANKDLSKDNETVENVNLNSAQANEDSANKDSSQDNKENTVLISDKEFMDDFEALVSKNIYPKFAYSFYMDFYKSVSKDIASTCMVTLVEHLESNSLVVRNDFIANGLQDDITQSSIFGNGNVTLNSADSDYYLLYKGVVIDNGFDTVNQTGKADLIIDYNSLLQCSDNLNQDIISYLEIAKLEAYNPTMIDNSMVVTFDEIADRINTTDNFLASFSNSEVYDKAYSLLYKYTDLYIAGDKYTTPFDVKSNLLRDDVKVSYENYIDNNSNTKYQLFLRDYYSLLSANGFKKIKGFDYESSLDGLYLNRN